MKVVYTLWLLVLASSCEAQLSPPKRLRCGTGYVTARPVTFENVGLDGFQIGEPLTGEAQRNFELVLRHYNVEVCERDGRLFIPEKWYSDEESMELIWNYTSKSQNPKWMRSREL